MKILFISHSNNFYGGSISTLNLMIGLRRLNHECILLLPNSGSFSEEAFKNGFKVIYRKYPRSYERIEAKGKIRKIASLFPSIFKALKLSKVILTESPDLIYSISSVIDSGFWLSIFYRIPHVWHIREYGNLHSNLQPKTGWKLYKMLLARTEALIFISKSLSAHFSVHSSKAHIIYNGIFWKEDLLRDEIKEIIQSSWNSFVNSEILSLGFVGRISKEKGFYTVLEALSSLKEKNIPFLLHVFGTCTDKEQLECSRLIKSYSLEGNIIFNGFSNNLLELYKSFDVLIMASEFEAFGRVTAEGMLYGKIAVANATGATPELVLPSKSGFLFDGSAKDLSNRLEYIYNNKESLKALVFEASNSIYNQFSYDDHVKQINDVLNKLVKNN